MGASWIRDRTHLHWQVDSLSLSTRESLSVILFEGLTLCSGVPCLSAQLPEQSTTDGWVLKQQNCRQKSEIKMLAVSTPSESHEGRKALSPAALLGLRVAVFMFTRLSPCVCLHPHFLFLKGHTHTHKRTPVKLS